MSEQPSSMTPAAPPPLPPPLPAPAPSRFWKGLSIALSGVLAVVVMLGAGLGAFFYFGGLPTSFSGRQPDLKPVPPLEPVTRTSMVIAPVAIALPAIRDVLESNAPRDMKGTQDNPYGNMLGKSDISWTAQRGPIQVVGTASGVNISTTVNGTARLSGQNVNSRDNIANRLGGMLGGRMGRQAEDFARTTLQQTAVINGNVTMTGRPVLLPNWRFDPQLTGQANMGEVNFAGFKFDATSQIKPQLDSTMAEQMTALSNRLRNDPMLEDAVKPEWAKMCRSVSLGSPAPNSPPLWLEVRPTQAIASQPRFVQDWAILSIGVRAETRIVTAETKPNCPFPSQLEIVPQVDQGKVAIAVPIDIPMTELNRVLEQELKGKTFTESAGEVTVLGVKVAASGDRLLISSRVKAHETKSWFGFNAEADIHMWGKPALDTGSQIMRLTDVSLDVDSDTALAGAALRAALPFVQSAIEKNAAIDLKPYTANALTSIETILADFKKPVDGVEIDAAITGLRLASISFDAKTLRVIGEAQGNARALIRKLPK